MEAPQVEDTQVPSSKGGVGVHLKCRDEGVVSFNLESTESLGTCFAIQVCLVWSEIKLQGSPFKSLWSPFGSLWIPLECPVTHPEMIASPVR